jgi:hypothetical protein
MDPDDHGQARVETRPRGINAEEETIHEMTWSRIEYTTYLKKRQSSEFVGEVSRLTEADSTAVKGLIEFCPVGA